MALQSVRRQLDDLRRQLNLGHLKFCGALVYDDPKETAEDAIKRATGPGLYVVLGDFDTCAARFAEVSTNRKVTWHVPAVDGGWK